MMFAANFGFFRKNRQSTSRCFLEMDWRKLDRTGVVSQDVGVGVSVGTGVPGVSGTVGVSVGVTAGVSVGVSVGVLVTVGVVVIVGVVVKVGVIVAGTGLLVSQPMIPDSVVFRTP
jgi:hypothetical protein